VQRRILLGTYAPRPAITTPTTSPRSGPGTRIRREYERAFAACDVMMTPAAPDAAVPAREKMEDPLAMYLSDIFTIGANLAGIPSGLPFRSARRQPPAARGPVARRRLRAAGWPPVGRSRWAATRSG
jgi:Asp-tRNA(Asn)/Glu-tRNA(Gln) amidotransferase A subunit family amidase